MKFDSNLEMKGRLTISLNDEVVQEIDNLVVTAGKNFVASRMASNSTAVMSHMGIGTDNTAAAANQTALIAQHSDGRVALTGTPSASGADVTYVGTFGPGVSSGAITEAGIFNGATNETMLCRTVFAVVNKGASDSMVVTWTVTAS